jgi:hypothetical protein
MMGLIVWLASVCAQPAARAAADSPPEVGVVRDFVAAWNTPDLEGVVALFADDARVRQRGPEISEYGPNVEVDDVFGSAWSYAGELPVSDGDAVVWATGKREIWAWVSRLLAGGHRIVASNYRLQDNTVTWDYQVPAPALWRVGLPQLPPATGTIDALIVDGRITRFTLTSTPGAAAARRRAILGALATTHAHETRAASDTLPPPGAPNTQDRTTPSPAPWLIAIVLSLAATLGVSALQRSAA